MLETVMKETIARGARKQVRLISRHTPSTGGPSAPKESEASPREPDDPPSRCERLEAVHGRCSRDSAGVRGRREGGAPLAPADWNLEEAPWAESDRPRTPGRRERSRRRPLGSWRIDASRQEPRKPSGLTEGWEARSERVDCSAGQGEGVAEASHPQTCEKAPQEIEKIEHARPALHELTEHRFCGGSCSFPLQSYGGFDEGEHATWRAREVINLAGSEY